MSRIITFYSYKGGVGRTMCLANVAMLLAKWGHRVLIIDWDLEAPGLENFFKDYIKVEDVEHQYGIIDIIHDEIQEVSNEKEQTTSLKDWKTCIVNIPIQGHHHKLDMLTAGKRDEKYYRKVRTFDVKNFYREKNGEEIIEDLRQQWKEHYDFILVDSRTGITDIGGICTIQLPDILVILFTATEQGFLGIKSVAERAYASRKELGFQRLNLLTLPVPTRLDNSEKKLTEEWLDKFEQGLEKIFNHWLPTSVDRGDFLRLIKVPYITYYSYGEKLPVTEKSGTVDTTGIGYAYQSIAALIATRLDYPHLLIENRDKLLKIADSFYIQELFKSISAIISESLRYEEIKQVLNEEQLVIYKDEKFRQTLKSPNSVENISKSTPLNEYVTYVSDRIFNEIKQVDTDCLQLLQESIIKDISVQITNLFTAKSIKGQEAILISLIKKVSDKLIYHIHNKIEKDRNRNNDILNNLPQTNENFAVKHGSSVANTNYWRRNYIFLAGFLVVLISVWIITQNKSSLNKEDNSQPADAPLNPVLYKDSAYQALEEEDTTAASNYFDKSVDQALDAENDPQAIEIAKNIYRDKYEALSKDEVVNSVSNFQNFSPTERKLNAAVRSKYGKDLYRVTIFYNEEDIKNKRPIADSLLQLLKDEKNIVAIMRTLDPKLYKNYNIKRNTIKYENQNEYEVADLIASKALSFGLKFHLMKIKEGESPRSLSVFIR
ncbi:AAA family ATPase [Flavisolibacter sp. BT320]|nr:AAA family ATPase [Flavisolibacter longurius]